MMAGVDPSPAIDTRQSIAGVFEEKLADAVRRVNGLIGFEKDHFDVHDLWILLLDVSLEGQRRCAGSLLSENHHQVIVLLISVGHDDIVTGVRNLAGRKVLSDLAPAPCGFAGPLLPEICLTFGGSCARHAVPTRCEDDKSQAEFHRCASDSNPGESGGMDLVG
jgi:hypothetical protein